MKILSIDFFTVKTKANICNIQTEGSTHVTLMTEWMLSSKLQFSLNYIMDLV